MKLKILTPKLFDFRTLEEYEEWFHNHSFYILEPGEVWFAKLHDLDEYRISIGTGVAFNQIIPMRVLNA